MHKLVEKHNAQIPPKWIFLQKELGVWEDTMCLAQRNVTLDFYYRLYSLVLEYTPERGHGYKNVILNGYIPGTKTLIISQMGGGIARLISERSTRLLRPWKRSVADRGRPVWVGL